MDGGEHGRRLAWVGQKTIRRSGTAKMEPAMLSTSSQLDASGLDKARVLHRPRLLSDNGSSYISDDLAKWMKRHTMVHVARTG